MAHPEQRTFMTYVKDKFTNYGGNFISNVLGKNETNIAPVQFKKKQ